VYEVPRRYLLVEELLAVTFAHDEKGLRALCRALSQLKAQLAVPAIGD
jgi:hypothetical protein